MNTQQLMKVEMILCKTHLVQQTWIYSLINVKVL